MVQHNYYNAFNKVPSYLKKSIVNFLFENQEGEKVGKEAIAEAIEYAVKDRPSFGGFILTAGEADKILGAIIVNNTGLELNPKNRIVYLAITGKSRSNGIASKLMKKAIDLTHGDLTLHLRPDNRSMKLFEKLGFQTKYVEMQLDRKHASQN